MEGTGFCWLLGLGTVCDPGGGGSHMTTGLYGVGSGTGGREAGVGGLLGVKEVLADMGRVLGGVYWQPSRVILLECLKAELGCWVVGKLCRV